MTHTRQSRQLVLLAALDCILTAALTGCGTGNSGSAGSATGAPPQLTGRIMGGQQPIGNATIQLYAVNPYSLKGASTPLLNPTVTTNYNGYFNITGRYSCAQNGMQDSLVYIVASGGNAGGGTNSAIGGMVGLGSCIALQTNLPFITINEVTTVASTYALAPFMADEADIGYTGSASGITNAFANINTLVDIGGGLSPGVVSSNIAVPFTEINTLANIVAACINSSNASTICSTLFGLALPPGGTTAPTNTIRAVLNLARNPAANVAKIFALPTSQPPFQPALLTAPNDFSLALKLTHPSLSSPFGIAIDASGDAWVTNESGTSITEFSPSGSVLSGANGFASPYLVGAQGITIDPSGQIWIANTGAQSVLELNPDGSLANTAPGYTNGISAPVDVAANKSGYIAVANFGNSSVTAIDNSGNVVFTSYNTTQPQAVAFDFSGNLWIASTGSSTLFEYNQNGQLLSYNGGYTDGSLQAPAFIAFDASGNAWTPGAGGAELSGFSSSGGSITGASTPVYSVLSHPKGIATDSAETIWVANSTTAGSLSEFTASTGAPAAASLGTLNTPVQIAVDGSGSVWTANSGDNSVTLFIGLAAPTATPLVARTQ
jgi:streptogramin lyase